MLVLSFWRFPLVQGYKSKTHRDLEQIRNKLKIAAYIVETT